MPSPPPPPGGTGLPECLPFKGMAPRPLRRQSWEEKIYISKRAEAGLMTAHCLKSLL